MGKHIPILLLSILLMAVAFIARSQDLTVGSPAPAFTLGIKNGINGKTAIRSLNSYKGKWLVLEFWSRTCSSCIEGFPKLERIREKYREIATVLLIGNNEPRYNLGIEKFYAKLAGQQQLRLDHGFSAGIFTEYKVNSYPHIVIVSPDGKVASVTYPQEMTEENLDLLFSGKQNPMVQKTTYIKKQIASRPVVITDSTSNFPHQSSITPWKHGDPINITLDLKKGLKNGRFSNSGTQLERLYLLAYFGKALWHPGDSLYGKASLRAVLELTDTSRFVVNGVRSLGQYAYHIQMQDQKADLSDLQQAMQSDLAQWMCYTALVEKRAVPVYALTISEENAIRLKSASVEKKINVDATMFDFTACSTADILKTINNFHQMVQLDDRTMISFPIDLKIEAPMTDLKAVMSALAEKGLIFEPASKFMDVLVISENKVVKK
jgi:thiol-disulfide isomerase/thioredoxin